MTQNFRYIASFAVCILLLFSLTACAKNDEYANISNEGLQELLDQGVTLVDIRRPEEWRQTGIVKSSHTITLFDRKGRIVENFVSRLSAIAPIDQPVVLICRTGNRTRAASAMLVKQLGYQKVYNVTRGITDWIRKGRPVARL